MQCACILLFADAVGACASSNTSEIAALEKRYVVAYYDRNHDGIVDFELHDIPGAADAAWALSDTKFRGRYDVVARATAVYELNRNFGGDAFDLNLILGLRLGMR